MVDLHFKNTFVDKNISLLVFSYNTKADKLSAIRGNFTLAYTSNDSLNTDIERSKGLFTLMLVSEEPSAHKLLFRDYLTGDEEPLYRFLTVYFNHLIATMGWRNHLHFTPLWDACRAVPEHSSKATDGIISARKAKLNCGVLLPPNLMCKEAISGCYRSDYN